MFLVFRTGYNYLDIDRKYPGISTIKQYQHLIVATCDWSIEQQNILIKSLNTKLED